MQAERDQEYRCIYHVKELDEESPWHFDLSGILKKNGCTDSHRRICPTGHNFMSNDLHVYHYIMSYMFVYSALF